MSLLNPFGHRILAALAAHGERPAFITGAGEVGYRDADRLLRTLHSGLRAAGVAGEDVVAIMAGNRPEAVLAQVAAQLLGARVLMVPVSASTLDRVAAISTAGARVLVLDPLREPETQRELVEALELRTVLRLGEEDLLAAEPSEGALAVPDAVHTVFPSGGTTGTPKLIAHSGIYQAMAHIFSPDPAGPKRTLLLAPTSHLTGNTVVLGALLCGDTVVLHDGFDAGAVLRDVQRHRVNTMSLTPPRLAAVLDHPALADADLSSLRNVSLGAAPLSEARLRAALEVFGPIVSQGYGLTEAPMICDITAKEYTGNPHRLRSVGRVVPGMDARVVGPDGTTVDPGGVGEVHTRGLALMDGYHGQPSLTEAALVDGWLHTGDIGYFDADGYLYLLDRSTDVIVTGEHGTKVYTGIVEDALAAHPGVRSAAVFGVPGPGGEGELVHAIVVPVHPGALSGDDLRVHVRAVLGGEHFVPAGVDFADELPLTPVGKVDKKLLRAPFWAGASRGIA